MIPVRQFDPGSVEWLEQRQMKIGGSEISAVLGLSPFESRYSLWQGKRGFRESAEKPEMEWGNRLEDAVITKFLDDHPEYVSAGRGTYLDGERMWMIASPDQLLSSNYGEPTVAGLEAKTSPQGVGWGRSGSEDFPIYYYCQCVWNMHVCGLDRWHLAVLISGCDYREYVIDRDDDVDQDIVDLIAAGEEFMASLQAGEAPDIDEHSATYDIIREQHPEIDLQLAAEIDTVLAGDYLDTVIGIKKGERRLRGLKSRLMIEMGNARHAEVGGERFAFRMAQTRDGKQGIPYVRTDDRNLKRLMAREATDDLEEQSWQDE